MNATAVLQDWSVEYTRSISEVGVKESAISAVRNRVWLIKELWSVYFLLRQCTRLQQQLKRDFAGVQLKPSLTPFDIVTSTMNLYDRLQALDAKVRANWDANNSFIGTPLDAIRGVSRDLLEFADLLEASIDPRTYEAIAAARAEYERGEVYPFA